MNTMSRFLFLISFSLSWFVIISIAITSMVVSSLIVLAVGELTAFVERLNCLQVKESMSAWVNLVVLKAIALSIVIGQGHAVRECAMFPLMWFASASRLTQMSTIIAVDSVVQSMESHCVYLNWSIR